MNPDGAANNVNVLVLVLVRTWREADVLVGPLVPEPVTNAQITELLGDDTGERRSDHAAADVFLDHASRVEVDVIDRAGNQIREALIICLKKSGLT